MGVVFGTTVLAGILGRFWYKRKTAKAAAAPAGAERPAPPADKDGDKTD